MSIPASGRTIPGGYKVVRVSGPNAAIVVEKIILTAKQRKRLTLGRLPKLRSGAISDKRKP